MDMSRSHQSQAPTNLIYLSRFSRPNTSSSNKGTTPGPNRPVVTQQKGVTRGTPSDSACLILHLTTLPGTTTAVIKVHMLLKVDKVLQPLLILSTLDVC